MVIVGKDIMNLDMQPNRLLKKIASSIFWVFFFLDFWVLRHIQFDSIICVNHQNEKKRPKYV
jgi:hypothetical protein